MKKGQIGSQPQHLHCPSTNPTGNSNYTKPMNQSVGNSCFFGFLCGPGLGKENNIDYSVIHEFIPAGRANHYMPSLKMWLGKSVLFRALTLPKKQHESLSVSSLIRKKQSTHDSLYIIIYIMKIQDKIPTDTKTTITSPPAHSSCLIKTAYMSNVSSVRYWWGIIVAKIMGDEAKIFTLSQVSENNQAHDCWIVINGKKISFSHSQN
ncbi:hypothetical protein YC2023_049852 [Brassica napus]